LQLLKTTIENKNSNSLDVNFLYEFLSSRKIAFCFFHKEETEGLDFTFTYVNEHFLIFAQCSEQILGKSILHIINEKKYGAWAIIVQELLFFNKKKVGFSQNGDDYIIEKQESENGILITFEKTTVEIKDTSLYSKEYSLLKENMMSAFSVQELVFDDKGNVADYIFKEVNPAFEIILGTKQKDIIGKKASEVLSSIDEFDLSVFEKVFKSNKPVKLVRFSSELNKHIELCAYKIGENEIAAIYADSTGKVNAERALVENEERYKLIFESAEDRIVLFDPYGGILYANKSFYNALGYTKDNYPYSNGEISKLALDFDFNNVRPENEEVVTHEYVVMHKNGKTMKMFATVKAVYGMNDGFFGLLGVIRDVTEQRLIENELINAKVRAEESDKLKSAFLANISHEIRTPLNGIVGFSRLICRQTNDETKKKKYIDLIESNGAQLMSIINSVIDTAKIESNQLELMFKNVDINRVLEEKYKHFREVLMKDEVQREINLKVSLPQDQEGVVLYPDKFRLEQIIENLISNAIKFTQEGFVEFGYEHGVDCLNFFVKDTGIGISEENKDMVFERFTQEDGSATRNFGGTGIGLSICKNLIVKMGGEIWFESSKGSGTQFYFTLPFSNEKEIRPDQLTDEKEGLETEIGRSRKKSPTALVVDDFSKVFYNSFHYLSEMNIKAYCASTLPETIRFLKEHNNINLIIIDVHMPDIDLPDLFDKIKALFDYQDVPIIGQIAYNLHEEKERLFEMGFDGYYSKPIRREVFYSVVDSVLEKDPA